MPFPRPASCRRTRAPPPPSGCAGSRSASPGWSRTTGSTSRPPRARCTPCSARTARARPRSRTSSPASTAPTRARSRSTGGRSVRLAPGRPRRRRLRWCTSTSGSSIRSPWPRTSCSATTGRGAPLPLRPRAIERRVAELGERYRLAVDPRAKIWQLSLGEQQRVEILKALYREARVLILDEPTAVLTPQEAESLFETLRAMAGEGRTIIFISHKLHEVMAVADRVTVLRRAVRSATVRRPARPRRAALMVGRELGGQRRDEQPATRSALEVRISGPRATAAAGGQGRLPSRARRRDRGRRRRRRQRPARAGGDHHRDAAALRAGCGWTARSWGRRSAETIGAGSRTSRRTGSARGSRQASLASNVVLKSYRGAPIPAGRSCAAGASAGRPMS